MILLELYLAICWVGMDTLSNQIQPAGLVLAYTKEAVLAVHWTLDQDQDFYHDQVNKRTSFNLWRNQLNYCRGIL